MICALGGALSGACSAGKADGRAVRALSARLLTQWAGLCLEGGGAGEGAGGEEGGGGGGVARWPVLSVAGRCRSGSWKGPRLEGACGWKGTSEVAVHV